MRLGKKQQIFSLAVANLIVEIYSRGYRVTLGDAYRDARVHGEWGEKESYSAAKSNHKKRLAIDLNLFDKDGSYLTSTEAHREFGHWWEANYGEYGARWGGHWQDGNHYEFDSSFKVPEKE